MRKKVVSLLIVCMMIILIFIPHKSLAADFNLLDEYKNVSVDKEWTITFNKEINRNTINDSSVYINDNYGNKIKSTVKIKDNKSVIIKPEDKFRPSSSYALYVTNKIEELNGSPLKTQVFVKFTTEQSYGLDNLFLSSNLKDDFIKAEVIKDKLIIDGATSTEHKYAWIQINDLTHRTVVDENININNNKFHGILNLPVEEGNYTFNVYYGSNRYGTYQGMYWNIPMVSEDGVVSFPKSIVYKHNKDIMNKNNSVNNSYLDLSEFNEKDRKVLKSLAEDITKGINDDYKKVFEISKWVSSNIYYNWDGYRSGNYGLTDAIGVLNERKSVCQGYAELTRALVRSVGIPAKLISGHALDVSAGGRGWDKVDHNKSNHAWNEVFVDGRWVIIDATWNSSNKYENGEFKKGEINYRYFDPTIEAFSYDHKILDMGDQ